MREIAYDISERLRVSFRFEGDVFQMEDQRNWTDATFKTFSTPLELPCPVEICEGAKVSQQISLTIEESSQAVEVPPPDTAVVLTIGSERSSPVPSIGLGLASDGEPLSAKEVRLLRALCLSHLRADLKLWEPGWTDLLRRAVRETRELGCDLEAAVIVSDSAEYELRSLRAAIERERPRIGRWLIFHRSEVVTSEPWIRLARDILKSSDRSALFGSGTNAGFYEMSGFRAPAGGLDFVCFSIQPQEHASGNASLIETLAIQRQVVENARRLHGGLQIAISPVTLKARFNPYATGPERPLAPGALPRQVDVRQMSLFGAVWTLGSLQYLGEARASSITYYETAGWRGVMEREFGPTAAAFPSIPGSVFPLYHVLADIGSCAGGEILPVHSSSPLEAYALAARKAGTLVVLAANMTGQTLDVIVRGLPARVDHSAIDEITVLEAMTRPEEFRLANAISRNAPNGTLRIALRPYAVARLLSQV